MTAWMILAVVLGLLPVAKGLQSGVEKITKQMMIGLLMLMLVLAFNSMLLDGAGEGLKFYLVPDFGKMIESGLSETVYAAMGQAFFTLSLGIGSISIFLVPILERNIASLVKLFASSALIHSLPCVAADHFPCCICLRSSARCWSFFDIHHTPQHFQSDGWRPYMGLPVLSFHELCGIKHAYCSL